MSKKPLPPSEPEVGTHLDGLASVYQHNPNQHVILNPFKNAILTFRAKYATYETITSTLNGDGVKVSEATVRKFCRNHQEEIKQRRREIERKFREAREAEGGTETQPASPDLGETPSTTDTNRPSDMGKPGPKIARERL